MTPRSEEEFAKIRSESRKAILDAATTLFARKGYSDTTIEDIAKKAGISKGLIYNYFPGKLEILEALMVDLIDLWDSFLTRSLGSSSPREILAGLITAWIDMIKSRPEVMRIFMHVSSSGHLAKLLLRRNAALITKLMESLIRLFRQLKSPDPVADAYLIGALFDGICLDYAAAPDIFPIEKVEKRIRALFTYPSD